MTKAKTTDKKPATKKTVSKKVTVKKAAPKKVVSQVSDKITVKGGDKIVTSDINGVGRRKSSVARVWLSRQGDLGSVVVNGRVANEYFTTQETRANAVKSLAVCNAQEKFAVKISVKGGGINSQSDAVRLGIARALVKDNEALKPALKEYKLLTVDARIKERKKPGQRGARRKFQFVKR